MAPNWSTCTDLRPTPLGEPAGSSSEFFRIEAVPIRNFRGFSLVLASIQLCLQVAPDCRKIILLLRFQPERAKRLTRLLTGLL